MINPYIRDFRNFDSEKFNHSLSQFTICETDDLDSSFENLHSHFLNCLNEHIPLRKRTKKESKFRFKPWISNSLKKSIKERNRLYRLSRINHQDQSQSQRKRTYNRYKKKLDVL